MAFEQQTKKFLDSQGVSTLWSKINAKVEAEALRAKAAEEANAAAAQAAQADVDALEALVGTLPEGTDATSVVDYVNKKTAGIATDAALEQLQLQVDEHEDSLKVLEGDVNTEGSAAYIANAAAVAKVAEIVAGADAKFDTLKEIADWIANDTTGAAAMANDISALEGLVGDVAVATQISDAIAAALKVDGADKYALASDLKALAVRVKALEDAGHVTQAAIDTGVQAAKDYADSLAKNYDAAGTAESKANAAEANAKAYADSLAKNYDAAGAAATAETNAKAFATSEANAVYASIIALTPAEVEAAINAAVTPQA